MLSGLVVLALAFAGQIEQPERMAGGAAEWSVIGPRSRAWYRAVFADGSTRIVKGWDDNGWVAWNETEQPIGDDGRPKYRREAAPKNYGIDMSELRNERRTIRASSPSTLAGVERELRKKPPCPGPNCPDKPDDEAHKPIGPIKRVEDDVTFWGACAIAAALFLAGVAVVGRAKR